MTVHFPFQNTYAALPANFFARVAHKWRVAKLLYTLQKDLNEVHAQHITDNNALIDKFRNLEPTMRDLDKCPDLVVNRGHYFGNKLPDSEKRALIAFLKTF